ncbi:hypothetical protein N657DRAFT_629311 [Parathielavia appendiculata]|uniref:Uncharacterized protein n=1 Tax=Parathielavia appendiculata TaxID=2587402 RepID=A0AAN6Z730_9PEZI|nr:hypothetical protein N657DRAFT_629311 [Parathielavia appendiculata]
MVSVEDSPPGFCSLQNPRPEENLSDFGRVQAAIAAEQRAVAAKRKVKPPASVTNTLVLYAPPADAATTTITVAAAVDSPDSAAIPQPLPPLSALPTLRGLPAPPSSPTPEEYCLSPSRLLFPRPSPITGVASSLLSSLARRWPSARPCSKWRKSAPSMCSNSASTTGCWTSSWPASPTGIPGSCNNSVSDGWRRREETKKEVRRRYGKASKTAILRAIAQAEEGASRSRAEQEAQLTAATQTRRFAEAELGLALSEESKAKAAWEAAHDAVAAKRVQVELAIVEETKVYGLLSGIEPDNLTTADQPEPSLTGMEPEKAAADELETATLNPLAEEPSPEVEQNETKAGAFVDATAADESEPKASSEEQAMVNGARTVPAGSKTESSLEQEGTTNAAPLAKSIPETADASVMELAQELEKAECALTLADEPGTVDAMEGLTQEPEKVEQDLAKGPETVDAMEGLTKEPDKAEPSSFAQMNRCSRPHTRRRTR